MATLRAMAILENVTALPEDRFVNTWHFLTASGSFAARQPVAEALVAFYNAGGPNGVASFLSPNVDRAASRAEIRVYDLADPEPRLPLVLPWTVGPSDGGSAMPNEVAGCLSFYAGRPLPRQRGRVFIGPLTSEAMAGATGDVELHGAFQAALVTAANALVDQEGMTWAVFSTQDQIAREVTGGWVDNAVDIVRKRGRKASSRELWGLAPSSGVGG